MNGRVALALLLVAALAVACSQPAPPPPPAGAVPAGSAVGSAAVTGRATYSGTVPPPEVISMASDPVCQARGAGQTREDVVIGDDGALANVFVYVVSGLGDVAFAPPETPAVLDQRGCTYRPHVIGVQVNQLLEIVNSDATLHNVHSMPAGNKPFNVGMPSEGMKIRRFFTEPEVMVRVKCDLHNWMTAWVGVVAHPFFAVTGPDGRFEIKGLPAGTYRIEAWHERFGTLDAEVTVADGETRQSDFAFQR